MNNKPNNTMRSIKTFLGAGALLCAASLPLYGISILSEYGFNIDGTVSANLVPAGVNIGGFDTGTGLGTITVTLDGAGGHYGGLFLDHDIDAAFNTFFNEIGTASGVPSAGQSWEIDEPGWTFGNIYDNFSAGSLDNSFGTADPEDVSMALAWAFSLSAGETALLSFNVSDTAPTAGFYLAQTDPDSDPNSGPTSLYFSSSLKIRGQGVPDGGSSLVLLVCAMTGLVGWRSRRNA
jgi:hypothetical protein